ncbi:zinc/cadmium/mercury/lead-transporting ATPase [Salmonella enterica subsp. enterica serovar Choleraesuis]|nr:zinc/cadmium/mercury/lead-transporting ATPase [Salmonella enterica subsp. enterica serovar Choleraesuis]
MTNLSRPNHKVPRFDSAHLVPEPTDSCCSGHCSTATTPPEQPLQPSTSGTRYSWRVEGMDCAACARKVENAARQVAGVNQVQVLFTTQKLLVDAERDIQNDVAQAVQSAGYTLQAVNTSTQEKWSWRDALPIIILAVLMVVSYVISRFSPGAGEVAFIATTLYGLWPVARQAIRLIASGSFFTIETLMSIACIGALIIGAVSEAAMVLLLFMLGEQLEAFSASRARRGVSALMALQPDEATVIRDGQRSTVSVSELRPGDIIEVAAGGRLPADAKLQSAAASFDESALTGESMPVERLSGERIAAGATSIDRRVTLEVVSEPGDSAIDRILRMIEEAEERRAPIERFIDRFSRIYTPIIMLLALLCAVVPPLLFSQSWEEWIYKGLALLLIGCPCALVISTPAAITSGLAAAARYGALIKGGAALEQLSRIEQIAFDKTGTLTMGQPRLVTTLSGPRLSDNELLTLTAAAEQGSSHPLAQAIINAAREQKLTLPESHNQRTLAGIGIEAEINGQRVAISAPDKLAAEILDTQWRERITGLENQGQTVVVVCIDGELAGGFGLRDTLRADAQPALASLREAGISSIMLTGDNPRAAAAIAAQLGIDYRASLLPADKVDAVTALNQKAPLAMVGDGINDAPAMKNASLGIAMGGGTDVALETADAALTHNRLETLPTMIKLARATRRNIRQNITIALGLKGIFLVTTLLGFTGLWLAVLADSGATALVTANALRLLHKRSL